MPQPTHFADDPADWFGDDATRVHSLSRAEAEGLQLAAARARFGALRDRLPPLTALAEAQGIAELASLDQAASLLFPHGFYKSYPEQLLVEGAYALMTDWLARLTTHDLSRVQGREFATMDDWLDALDIATPLEMYHSSGTSGRLSFYPRGKAEVAAQRRHAKMTLSEWYLPDHVAPGDWSFALFWPAHAFGRSAVLRVGRLLADMACEDVGDFHALLPSALSADYHYHVMRTRNMAEQGFAFGPIASPYVQARIEEAEALQRFVPERVGQFLDIMASLRGTKRIMLAGGPATIHMIAAAGLERGMAGVAMPGSIIHSFGGFKNSPEIPTAEADVSRFMGHALYRPAFGMTELTTGFNQCSAGRFHCPPWVVPYVLDAVTGALLPRAGVQRGRSAFLDLLPQSYWGGVITADRVEMSWDTCPCGRTTPHMGPDITRIADDAGGDAGMACAPAAAVEDALAALSEGLPRPQ